jgi:hypothetical protein
MYNWIFLLFTKCLLHVSTLSAPTLWRTLVTSPKICVYLKVVRMGDYHCTRAFIWKIRRNFYMKISKKLKCTLVQALRFCTGCTAHRGSRGIALLFYDHDTRKGWEFSVTPRPLFTSGEDPVPVVQKAGWAPGPVWTGVENLALTGIPGPSSP